MAAARIPWAADLLHVWFHRLRPDQWFGRSAVVDAELARRFGRVLRMQAHRQADRFLQTRATALGAVLLFDQVARNLNRDSAAAFARDPLARAICLGMLAKRRDRGLPRRARHFLYMPLMHSERRADQRLALALFARLGDPAALRFARDHARVVLRFGRFPHRNALLGRRSTPAERRAVEAGARW